LLAERLMEADWKDSAIVSQKESLRFKSPSSSPELAATLLISTMVGMRLPGKFATFVNFEINFKGSLEPGKSYRMTGKVEKYSEASQRADLSIAIDAPEDPSGANLAQGKAYSLVSPPPGEEVSFSEIQGSSMDLGLKGRVALVTGASRGIGCATAKLLASLGARVVVHYFRGEADARRIVEEISGSNGEARCLQADLREPEQIRTLVEQVAREWGTVDILVNNAVAEFSPKDVLKLEWDDYLGELEVSLKGLHAICRNVIPLMKKQSRGKIINLSSIATLSPVAGQNKYITAKSAVEGYTRSLAVELASSGIQVNLVLPAMTDTSLLANLPRSLIDRIGQERTAGRILKPIEVAQTIAFLASQWSDCISGQRFVINQAEAPFL
jgi:3-oxoacyl-[acyl-carrier protein] reductase